MKSAYEAFLQNVDRAKALHGLHVSLSSKITSALDISDLLRAQLVLLISAFDHFVHELVVLGMLESWDGLRPRTESYARFQVPLGSAASISDPSSGRRQLETEIRAKHGHVSFQQPDKIAEAIRLISNVELWNKISAKSRIPVVEIKTRLKIIVDRRNKIAHEADLDPSFPNQRWPIDIADLVDAQIFIVKIATHLYESVLLTE
jgi:hypothetical protein